MKNELTGETIDSGALGQVAKLANQQLALEAEIAIRETELEQLKEKHRLLSTQTIPDHMLEIGLSSISLANGAKVSVAPFYSAKIPDDFRQDAFNWLVKEKCDGIIKCDISAEYERGKRAEAVKLLQALHKKGYMNFHLEENVHWQTLKAFVKERITTNKSLPHDLFGVYVGNKTTIKVP